MRDTPGGGVVDDTQDVPGPQRQLRGSPGHRSSRWPTGRPAGHRHNRRRPAGRRGSNTTPRSETGCPRTSAGSRRRRGCRVRASPWRPTGRRDSGRRGRAWRGTLGLPTRSRTTPSFALRTRRWLRSGRNRSTTTRSDRQALQAGQRGRKSMRPNRRQPGSTMSQVFGRGSSRGDPTRIPGQALVGQVAARLGGAT